MSGDDLMMTWHQTRKLWHAGHIVGSHTLTHPNVAHLSDEQIVRMEQIESKRQTEEKLNAPAAHFSYPHPVLNLRWTQRTMQIVREAGYETAVTTTGGPVHGRDNPLVLTGVMARGSEDRFRWALETAFLGHVA